MYSLPICNFIVYNYVAITAEETIDKLVDELMEQ